MTEPRTYMEDYRPADFTARVSRRPRPVGRRRRVVRHYGRRLILLGVAIAVPAWAAPEQWQSIAPHMLGGAKVELVDPMPFEQAGQSFPGSAFYYLEDAPQITYEEPSLLETLNPFSSEKSAELAETHTAGPAARSFYLAGNGRDRMRASQCLSMAVYYEAASESRDGQRAVAQVILNRVAHPSYPNSVCGVVFQGSERVTGCQFSFTCDGSLRRRPAATAMARARMVAAGALAGDVFKPVGLATHYHATYVLPYWASSLDNVGTIGLHTFYRWRGAAGKSSAFRTAYRGGEPVAAPKPRSAVLESAAGTDPIALARAFEDARREAQASAAAADKQDLPAPPPAYSEAVEARGGDALFTADDLPEGGDVKAEYANSGRWIADPAKVK